MNTCQLNFLHNLGSAKLNLSRTPLSAKPAAHKPPQRSSASPPKVVSQPVVAAEEVKKLSFPLENYEFKLACKSCFVKTGEGVKGYRYDVLC